MTYLIIGYVVVAIATFIARLYYLVECENFEQEESIFFSVLYGLLWPIGFLYSIIFKFFRWL